MHREGQGTMSVSLPELDKAKSPARPSHRDLLPRHGAPSRSASGLPHHHSLASGDGSEPPRRRHAHAHAHSVDTYGGAGGAGLSRYEGTSLPSLRDIPPSRGLRIKSPTRRSEIDHGLDQRCAPPSGRESRNDLQSKFGITSSGMSHAISASPSRTSSRLTDLAVSRHDAPDDTRAALREVENLKRQVARLTQQRRDRDTYIQELLGAAEAAQARHEAEMARWTSRSQREVSERLAAQQREHALLMEERSRTHAAALAQQSVQHELELEELRKVLRAGGDQRLAERLGECVSQHRDALARLQHCAEDMRQRLASHVLAMEQMLPAVSALEQEDLCNASAGKASLESSSGTPGVMLRLQCQLTPSGNEPEPEAQGTREEPELRKTMAFVQQAARESADDVELTLGAMRADLGRARVAEQRLAVWFAHEAGGCRSDSLVEREQRRALRTSQFRGLGLALMSALSRLATTKVFLEWRAKVRRRHDVSVERGRCAHVRRRVRFCLDRRLLEQEALYLTCAIRAWATASCSGRAVRHASQDAAEARRRCRAQGFAALAAKAKLEKLLFLRCWASAAIRTRHEAQRVEDQSKVSSLRAEAQSLMGDAARSVAALRKARRDQGFRTIQVHKRQALFAAIQAWRSTAVEHRLVRHHEAKLEAATVEAAGELLNLQISTNRREERLRRQCRALWLASNVADNAHKQHVALRAWAEICARGKFDGLQKLQASSSEACLREQWLAYGMKKISADVKSFKLLVYSSWRASVEQSKVDKELYQAVASWESLCNSVRDMRGRMRKQALQVSRAWGQCRLSVVLFWWAAVLREKRNEAAHRRELLMAAADASAELYRFKAAAKATACELRRQRRAHGVAAVHANLDRRVQAVLAAWCSLVRDSQRESSYRRQLDAAAAESAQTCAAMRLEGRRVALELRKQRRNHGLRAIKSEIRRWRQTVLRAWSAVAAESRQQALIIDDLARALCAGAPCPEEPASLGSKQSVASAVSKKLSSANVKGSGLPGVLERWRRAHGAAAGALRSALLMYGIHMWQASVMLRRAATSRSGDFLQLSGTNDSVAPASVASAAVAAAEIAAKEIGFAAACSAAATLSGGAGEATAGGDVAEGDRAGGSGSETSGRVARTSVIDLGYGVRLVVFIAWRMAAMAARGGEPQRSCAHRGEST